MAVVSILCGLILLAGGAEALVRGSSSIALRLGVTALAVGLTVVAFGTGSPELAVSVQASLAGNGSLALGNVVGSNISNTALILGVAALARPLPVRSELVRREVPIMIGVTALLGALLYDGELSRLEGLLLVTGCVAYTALAYLAAKSDRSTVVAEEFGEAHPQPKRALGMDVVLVFAGLGALLAGAQLLVSGATVIATRLGISQAVIGLTVVAIGTSLPELATSVVASVRGEADVAFGNVIGSNILNILCILGIAALIRPVAVEGLRPLDMGVFIGSAVILLPLMRRGFTLYRWEGGLLVGGYGAYLWSLAI